MSCSRLSSHCQRPAACFLLAVVLGSRLFCLRPIIYYLKSNYRVFILAIPLVFNKIASTMTVTRVAESRTEFKLKSLPEDAISSVKFAPKSSQYLLVSSWDCSVRLYDVTSNIERHKYCHELPVMDVCFRV